MRYTLGLRGRNCSNTPHTWWPSAKRPKSSTLLIPSAASAYHSLISLEKLGRIWLKSSHLSLKTRRPWPKKLGRVSGSHSAAMLGALQSPTHLPTPLLAAAPLARLHLALHACEQSSWPTKVYFWKVSMKVSPIIATAGKWSLRNDWPDSVLASALGSQISSARSHFSS